nr:SLATT domain-containing protein [uncultured Pseudomonas sp.]
MLWLQPRTEDPVRIQAFKKAMDVLSWGPDDVLTSLNSLFGAVDDLADAELRYYYRRRRTRAWISGLTRLGAWILGSIGLIIPLLAATDDPCFEGVSSYGYLFLAMAGSLLAANTLFGGTDGHIRFVTTQLEIERIITKARLNWCEYIAAQKASGVDASKGFEQILAYANELHVSTIAETGRWGETLLKELAKYEQNLASKSGS